MDMNPKPSLDHVRTWIFDLDNTLYPTEIGLFDQIDLRMGTFISELLDISYAEARRVQKGFLVKYGTTLKGLMDEYGVDPQEFLSYAHAIDLSPVKPDAKLAKGLSDLDGLRYVFTNGDREYAVRVLEGLEIAHLFDGIFDVIAADYLPKPHPETYMRFVAHFDIDARRSAMIEDMARNLVPAAEMGMTTVWLSTGDEWGAIDKSEAHIHYTIDCLPTWLSGLAETRDKPE